MSVALGLHLRVALVVVPAKDEEERQTPDYIAIPFRSGRRQLGRIMHIPDIGLEMYVSGGHEVKTCREERLFGGGIAGAGLTRRCARGRTGIAIFIARGHVSARRGN